MIAIWINVNNKNIRIAGGYESQLTAYAKAHEIAMEKKCVAYLLDEDGVFDRIDGRV